MLNPSMQDLMKNINNRYLLVNVAAQRARDIVQEYEDAGEKIPDKPVKQALDEIAAFEIEYKDGPKPEPEKAEDVLAAVAESAEEAPSEEIEAAADDILED